MIARHRGDDMREHTHWRPGACAVAATAPPDTDLETEVDELREDESSEPIREKRQDAPRRSRMPIAIATLVLVVVIAGQQHASPAPAANALPATPRAWVDKWIAASLEYMGRVCRRLFSPALAAADKADTVLNCTSNHHSTRSSSLRVEHILHDGPTATIEAHKAGAASKSGYFTVVLSHIRSGWQAVDVVPGGTVRLR